MDTITRRELFRRVGRAAVVGPLMLATRDQQVSVLFALARLFKRSAIGRMLWALWEIW